jgi:hypothetical protein
MRDFTSVLDLADEVQDMVERHVQGMRRVSAVELGLDIRCGSAYVDEDMESIVVESSNERSYNYYGGFEYIDDEDKRMLGDYTVFLDTSDRVRDALECLMEKDGLCEEEAE